MRRETTDRTSGGERTHTERQTAVPTYESVTRSFLEMELDLDLFEWAIDGVPVWERLRFDVHKAILEGTGVLDEPHASTGQTDRRGRIRDLVEAFTVRNPLFSRDADIVVLGHPRRKRLDDGHWWNVRCDPVVHRLDSRWVLLESSMGHGHSRPPRTERLRYLDAVELPARVRLRLDRSRLAASDRALLTRVRETIDDRFDVDVDVRARARRVRAFRRSHLPWYVSLLERLDPEIVVLTVSYGYARETQIEACRRLGIPVVELQHGVIDPYHPGYSFPGPERDKCAFPDYLLVYGRFWRDAVEYPLPEERVRPVGHPFLERQARTYQDRSERDQFVFVSQGAIGRRLSKFAAELASNPAFEHDIVYKLHPAETERYPEEYPWLASADLRVSDGSDQSLYDLFAASTAQVGVYSTALYEGLRFGLQTYLVDLPGAVKLDPLVEDGTATLVGSVDELVATSDEGDTLVSGYDRYFARDALEAVPETIDRLARAGSQYEGRDYQL